MYPYVGSITFSGACLVPKLGLDIMGCEVARVLNVASDGSNIIPVSAVVPRKTHADFHADIFPDTREDIPQVAVTEWLTGINTTPRIVSLDPAKRQSFAPVTTTESTASLSTLPNQIQPLLDSTKNSISDIQMQINTPDSASTTIPTAIKNSAKVNLPKHSAYRFITGKSNTDYDDLKGLSVNFPNETDAFQVCYYSCTFKLQAQSCLVLLIVWHMFINHSRSIQNLLHFQFLALAVVLVCGPLNPKVVFQLKFHAL